MEKFLKVIKGIDWDMLHRQKMQLIERLGDKPDEIDGLLNLIDDLQDVAAYLRIWVFPSERYDGKCPECDSKNWEYLEEENGVLKYECYDCGILFSIKES